jgi:Leucine-rich repeat (LRR) protein
MRSVSLVLVFAFSIIFTAAAFSEEAAVVVPFKDESLIAAVRSAINKPTGPILSTDLVGKNFTALNAANMEPKITDLSGLEYCKDLTLLQLYSNDVEDLTPIAGLTKLTDLYLWENQIQDITPLTGLVNLRRVFLHNNYITDINALVNNTGIGTGDVINITGNNINQISLCNYIPVLESRSVQITYSGVCGQILVQFTDKNLEERVRFSFRIQTGRVLPESIFHTDLADTGFKELYASNSNISDITGLEYCLNLEKIYLDGNNIKNLSPLSDLGKVTVLRLGGNNISDLRPLKLMYGISDLELENNKISDLQGVGQLRGLLKLCLHSNSISSLSAIAELYNLRELTLGYQVDVDGKPTLTAVPEIAEFNSLENLDLSGNKISNLSPIRNLINLRCLNIADMHDLAANGSRIPLVSSITDVAKLTALEILDASTNQILDITPIANLQELSLLYLHDNKITNVVTMAGLPKLARTTLMNNQISDISPLVANTGIGESDSLFNMDHVDLRGNSLSQESLCQDVPALQARHVIVAYDGFCCEESERYTLVTSVQGEGTVDPPGTHKFCWGSKMTLAANPEPGYRFSEWTGDLTGTQNPVDIEIISNMNITANFVDITKLYKILLSTGGEGTIQLDPPQPEEGYSSGQNVNLTPVAAAGWVFDHWEGALQGTAYPMQIKVDADKEVGAIFKKLGPIYKLTTATTTGGSITPAPGEHPYEGGTTVVITAIPEIGYVFDRWEGDITGANPAVITMDGHKTVTARFKPDGYDYTLAMIIDGSGTTSPPAGYNRYYANDEVTVSATPAAGWVFDHWSGDLAGDQNPATIVLEKDKTVRAVFIASVTYVLTMSTVGGGTVTPPAGEHVYAADKKVMLLATPDKGWVFDHWEGDVGGVSNPYTIEMDGNIEAVAAFRPFPFIDSITPQSGYTTGNTDVVIAGGNLDTTSRVLFGTVPGVITSAAGNEVIVRAPAHEKGVVDVSVETSLGNVAKLGGFTYLDPPGPPQIDLVQPNQGSVVGATTVAIRGRNLGPATSITFGDAEVEEVVSRESTRLVVVAPILEEVPETLPYTVDVTVTTPFGSTTCSGCFSYVRRPQIASVYPSQGYIDGGTTVTIKGIGFTNADSVTFDTLEASIVSASDTQLVVTTPPHAADIVNVTVSTPLGSGTLEEAFNYFSESAKITCSLWNESTNKPVTDATVRLDPQTLEIHGSETGVYTFEHVRPGTYEVTVITSYCELATQTVTVQQNDQAGLNFQLNCSGGIKPAKPCGFNVGQLRDKFAEQTIPPHLKADPDGFITPTGEIAVRMSVPGGIEPSSTWAVAEGQSWSCSGGLWRPIVAGDNSDGWIILVPEPPIPVGEVITVTAGAVKAGGENIEPVSFMFAVGPDDLAKSGPAAAGTIVDDGVEGLPEPVAISGCKVYRTAPDAAYEQPYLVRLPVPKDVLPDSIGIYYYSKAQDYEGWHPAENVLGWMVPGSRRITQIDDKSYLEFYVNHAGIFQLGKQLNMKATAVEIQGSRGQWASLLVLLTLLSIALGMIVRRKQV